MTADTPEIKFPERTAAALPMLIKLIALANAGGVAATMTVIAATARNGGIENSLAWPLGLFSAGVFFVILYAMGTFLKLAQYENYEPNPLEFFVDARFIRFVGYGAGVFFFVGCFIGVGIVAFS